MIKISELSKTFQAGKRKIHAVKSVSFDVDHGQVFGLLGPNGAGKTTTMRMILGLLGPDAGFAEIAGIRSDVYPDEIKRRVGFLSASAGVYQWLSGLEVLQFFGDVYGLSPGTAQQRIEELSELLQLNDFLGQRCSTLSTGQKQRINLARALVHDPPVMMLDEPTLGLDVVGSQVIFEYIELLKSQNKAVILCTHRLEQAQRICDRFGLLHEGSMVHQGSLEQLQEQTGRNDLVEMFIDFIKTSQSNRPEDRGSQSPVENVEATSE